jgi:hypothetical protein
MDVRKALLFIAGQEYKNYSSININPGGLRKLGSADLVLKNLGLNFQLSIPATLSDSKGGFSMTSYGNLKPVITPHGKELEFNGVDTYLDTPDDDDFVFFDISISVWYKSPDRDSLTPEYLVDHHRSDSGFGFYVHNLLDKAAFFIEGDSSADQTYCAGTSDVCDGEWHHIVLVRDTSAGKCRIYVDNVMENEVDDISDGHIDTADPIYIGRVRGSVVTNVLTGVLDSVRIYKKVLTAGEISEAYLGRPSREGLFAEWTFEDIVTNPRSSFQDQLGETVIQLEDSVLELPSEIVDSTGNGNDLTPHNDPYGNVKAVYDDGEKAIYFRGLGSVQNYGYLEKATPNEYMRHFGDESWDSDGLTVIVDLKTLDDLNWVCITSAGSWSITYTAAWRQFQPAVQIGATTYYTGGKGELVLGQRTQIVLRWDRASQLLEAWQDGVNLGTRDTPPDLPLDEPSSYLRLHHGWYGQNIVYSARVWKRPLSQSEIEGLWNDRTSVPRQGLVAEWTFDDVTGARKNVFRGYPVEMDETYPDIVLSLEDFASFLKWRIIKYDHIYRQIRLGDIFIDLLSKYAPEISPGEIDPLLPWVRFCKVKEGYKLFDTFGELGRKYNIGFHVDADKVFHAFNLSTVSAAAYTIEEGENVEISNLRREFDKILSKAIMTCTLNNPLLRDEWTNDVPVDDWESSPQLLATLNPTHDSWAEEQNPSTTHGSEVVMEAFHHKTSGNDNWAYLKFDISAYDDFGDGCLLRVYCTYRREPSDTYYLKKCSDDTWDEATLDWDNHPATGDTIWSGSCGSQGVWKQFDVTEYLQEAKDAARTSITFVFTFETNPMYTSGTIEFATKESANDPQLLIYGFDEGGVFKDRINAAYRSFCLVAGKSFYRARYPDGLTLDLDISLYPSFHMKAKAESAITVALRLCKDKDNYYSVNMSVTTSYQSFDYDSIKNDMTATGTPGEEINYVQLNKPTSPDTAFFIDLMYFYGEDSKIEVEIGQTTFGFWSDRADFLNKGFVGTLDDAKTFLNDYITARHEQVLSPQVSLPIRKLGGDVLNAIHPGTVINLKLGSSGFDENLFALEPKWTITPDSILFSAMLSNVIGGLAEYLFNPTMNTINVEEIELACETACEIGCELTCETGCETGCETACQELACEIGCQTGCKTACQDTCELACQTTCQQNCQTECEIGCLGSCKTECQTACEKGCETSCEISCQSSCRLECKLACRVSCRTACELGCETECETSCQADCEFDCKAACEISCETGCLFGVCKTTCESGCQTECESTCMTSCETSCQTTCEIACQTSCELACQTTCELSCKTACEGAGCETQCQTTCQTSCELACKTGCEDTCQTACMNACQTACEAGCLGACETSCQEDCELNCQENCELACQNTCMIECKTCAQTVFYAGNGPI